MFDATVMNALIASPGDTLQARDAIERTIYLWNSDRARSAGVVALPRRWETDSVPLLGGGDGQSIINKQLVDEADVVFGVFHSRLGKATPRHASGTAEEISRTADAGKPVHVYFADMPHPPNVDPEELARLNAFRAEMESRGLYGTFVSTEDLAQKVRTALEHDIQELGLGEPTPGRGRGEVVLRARYENEREPYVDNRNKIRHRTRKSRLVIHNKGTSTAHSLRIEITAIGQGEPPHLLDRDNVQPDLLADAEWSYPLGVYMGMAGAWNVRMVWQDDSGREHAATQQVTM